MHTASVDNPNTKGRLTSTTVLECPHDALSRTARRNLGKRKHNIRDTQLRPIDSWPVTQISIITAVNSPSRADKNVLIIVRV